MKDYKQHHKNSHNNHNDGILFISAIVAIIPIVMFLALFLISFALPHSTSPASQSDSSSTASSDVSDPAKTGELLDSPLSYNEFMSKMEDEIMAETQASLESVFVRYPDFIVQERTIILGQGGTEESNRDIAVVVSELNKAYQDSKMSIVVEHKDSMNDNQSAVLLEGNVALSIDYGNFSVEKE